MFLHPSGIISYGADNCRKGVLRDVSTFLTKPSLSLGCVTFLLSIGSELNEH